MEEKPFANDDTSYEEPEQHSLGESVDLFVGTWGLDGSVKSRSELGEDISASNEAYDDKGNPLSKSQKTNFVTHSYGGPKREKLLFQPLVKEYVDRDGRKHSDIYNCVGMANQVFSDMYNHGLRKSLKSIFMLAVALELSLEEFEKLLVAANIQLDFCRWVDVICYDAIADGIYNQIDIDETLIKHHEKTIFSIE